MKINIYNILNKLFTILIFVIVVDPTNTLLKLKEVCFASLLALYFIIKYRNKDLRFDKSVIILLFVVFFINTFCFVLGELRAFRFDYSRVIESYKTFLFFAVLFFVKDPKIESLIEKLIFPSVFISIITIVIFSIIINLSVADFENYPLDLTLNGTIMYGGRNFLGINFSQVFYKSSPVLVLSLAFVYDQAINMPKKRLLNILYTLLFLTALIMSGTRANMFSGILIILSISVVKMSKSKIGRLAFYPLSILLLFFFFVMTNKLMSQKDDHSIEVKMGHYESIMNLFSEHPSVLFVGQGPGAYFYSSGLKEEISLSELTYLEIARKYGLFFGGIIFAIFLVPLYVIRKKRLKNSFPFIVGYIAYLFIGGTNPLLLSSTGILVLAIAYSYAYNRNFKKSEKNCNSLSNL